MFDFGANMSIQLFDGFSRLECIALRGNPVRPLPRFPAISVAIRRRRRNVLFRFSA